MFNSELAKAALRFIRLHIDKVNASSNVMQLVMALVMAVGSAEK